MMYRNTENEVFQTNMVEQSIFSISFFCIKAVQKPAFTIVSDILINTISIATTPKSSGISNRANIKLAINMNADEPNLSTALHSIPDIASCFNLPVIIK